MPDLQPTQPTQPQPSPPATPAVPRQPNPYLARRIPQSVAAFSQPSQLPQAHPQSAPQPVSRQSNKEQQRAAYLREKNQRKELDSLRAFSSKIVDDHISALDEGDRELVNRLGGKDHLQRYEVFQALHRAGKLGAKEVPQVPPATTAPPRNQLASPKPQSGEESIWNEYQKLQKAGSFAAHQFRKRHSAVIEKFLSAQRS